MSACVSYVTEKVTKCLVSLVFCMWSLPIGVGVECLV